MFEQKFLSIDIGNDSIKILEVTDKKEKLVVSNAIRITKETNALEDGYIRHKEIIINSIKAALEENEIKSKNVVFSISSSKIITREVIIPFINPKKISSIIKMNASEYFPVNINDYIIDHIILDTFDDKGSKKLKVLIIAAPDTLVAGYVEIAGLLDLKIKAIDYVGNSVYQLLQKQFFKGTNLFIELEAESTVVTIMNNGDLELQRYLPYGVSDIYKGVMEHFAISYKEAVEMMRTKSFLNYDTDHNPYLTGDVTAAVNKILGGVSRILDYYTSRSNKTINRAYLMGSGNEIASLVRYVEKFFNLNVEIIDRIYGVEVDKVQGFDQEQIYYSICLGAALTKLNLVPAQVLSENIKNKRRRMAVELAILAGLLSLSTLMIPITEMGSLRKEKSRLQQQVATAREFDVYLNEHKQLQKQIDFRNQIINFSYNPSEALLSIINELEVIMPSNSYYINMSNTKDILNVSGFASDKLTVAKFIEQIKKMDQHFHSVFVPSISVAEDEMLGEVWSFSAIITHR